MRVLVHRQPTTFCSTIPPPARRKLATFVGLTRKDKKERGFRLCGDGSITAECVGTECSVSIHGCETQGGTYAEFHTHPLTESRYYELERPYIFEYGFQEHFSIPDYRARSNATGDCLGFERKGAAVMKCVRRDDIHDYYVNDADRKIKAALRALAPTREVADTLNKAMVDTYNILEQASKVCEEVLGPLEPVGAVGVQTTLGAFA